MAAGTIPHHRARHAVGAAAVLGRTRWPLFFPLSVRGFLGFAAGAGAGGGAASAGGGVAGAGAAGGAAGAGGEAAGAGAEAARLAARLAWAFSKADFGAFDLALRGTSNEPSSTSL